MRFAIRGVLVVLMAGALVLSACDTITHNTELRDLETHNAQLQGTIQGLGTPMLTIVALQQAATQNVVLQAQLSQAQNDALAAQATLTVLQLTGGGGAIQATPIPPSVPAGDQPSGLPTPPASGGSATAFTQTVTATGRNAQDCPTGVTSTFEITTGTIYVNARINYLPAGSTLGARWTANGALFFDDTECWVPDQDYYDICAYCSIVPDGPAFEAGNWTVELLFNGQVLSQTQFQVVDSSAGGSLVTPAVTPVSGEVGGGMAR
jgi:hypothetical protein